MLCNMNIPFVTIFRHSGDSDKILIETILKAKSLCNVHGFNSMRVFICKQLTQG